jgi:hypothetical protein
MKGPDNHQRRSVMRTFQIRQVAATAALALMAAAPLAACGADSVSPLPVQAAETATSVPASPSPSPSPTPAPSASVASASPRSSPTRPRPTKTKVKTTRPTPKATSTCYGAVRHDIDLQNTELALIRSMCFHAGGVLRLKGIGPGLVTATPESLVDQNYEGGVVDLRFLRAGTVTVKIPQEEQTYTITVVVVS